MTKRNLLNKSNATGTNYFTIFLQNINVTNFLLVSTRPTVNITFIHQLEPSHNKAWLDFPSIYKLQPKPSITELPSHHASRLKLSCCQLSRLPAGRLCISVVSKSTHNMNLHVATYWFVIIQLLLKKFV